MNLENELRLLLEDEQIEINEQIQNLWAGYGQIIRIYSPKAQRHFIVKVTGKRQPDTHPTGWNTSVSHDRKVQSYLIESYFYQAYASQCTAECRVAQLVAEKDSDDGQILVLEDLDEAGYPVRKEQANWDSLSLALTWLAHFHAQFIGSSSQGLWPIGTYWHLGTRQQEWQKMEDSPFKQKAEKIDQTLNNAQYQTLVHGDAKFQNLCFGLSSDSVAAVDFQYVGRGVGVKDVVCLMAGCLTESDLETHAEAGFAFYLDVLAKALKKANKESKAEQVIAEYQSLYHIAWADLYRFLLGWNPSSWKISGYMQQMAKKGLMQL